jgi:hypothetical protein
MRRSSGLFLTAVASALAFGSLVAAPDARAEEGDLHFWALRDRMYFDPHLSSPRDAMIKVLFPALSPAVPFATTPGTRLVWDISLGKEIPLFGWETSPSTLNDFAKGRWGFGFWIPIGFHMLEDLNGDPSSPILDTDYRFGLMLKARWAVREDTWLKFRAYGGHESTHIGDEFALAAQRTYPNFTRINVSHEDWDVAGGLDHVFADAWEGHALIGFIGLLRPSKGYYSTDTLETNGAVVPGSSNNLEPYASAEAFAYKWPWAALSSWSWAPWASVDLRWRSIYDYTRASASIPEDRQLSANLLVGLRNQERKRGQRGAVDVYLRGYYGVNPAGQFRSQADYWLFGFGLHVPI